MSRSETFHNITSGIASFFQIIAVIAGAYWAIYVFPEASEARRGWPGHPTVDGCVAVRRHGLGGSAHYVEAGLSVANNTAKDVLLDSVRFEVLSGTLGTEAVASPAYDVENPQFVAMREVPGLAMTVKPGAQRGLSGYVVRPRETKHFWRGTVIKDAGRRGPYEFIVQAFVAGEGDPFGFGRPMWLTDNTGKCPWNAS